MIERSKKKPIVLLILDGWGVAGPSETNMINNARTPVFDELIASFPATVLKTDGPEMGYLFNERPSLENSYWAMGTGRPNYNNLFRINKAIDNNTFIDNKALNEAVQNVKTNNSKLHLLGLASEANIHSSVDHIEQLLKLAKENNIDKVFLHIILDGVDTKGDKGIEYIEKIQKYISEYNIGEIASISGRFYGLDRDNHWERTTKVYNAMVKGEGRTAFSPSVSLKESYNKQIYDKEFFPTVIVNKDGYPKAVIEECDSLILFNLREDRWKQLVKAFAVPGLEKIPDRKFLKNLHFTAFSSCGKNMPVNIAFPYTETLNTLADVLRSHEMNWLRLAPSEKYGLVTYYFDGKKDPETLSDQRKIFTSKEGVAEQEISDEIINSVLNEDNDLVVATLTNLDEMVDYASYGDIIKIIENIDHSLQRLYKETLNKGGALLVTSSAGCIENAYDPVSGDFNKELTCNGVPFVAVGKDREGRAIKDKETVGDDLSLIKPEYSLLDVPPTILKILGIEKPKEMKGRSIL